MATAGGRDPPRGQREPVGGEHLPARRPGPLGRPMAASGTHGEMSSSCATAMTSSSASSTGTTPSSFGDLRERFRFHLELHPEKTRLIEFGRYAAERRQRRGQGKPETFDFLGLTHMCGTTRKGKFTVRRKTIARRLRKKLQEVKQTLRRRMALAHPAAGAWLRAVLLGHYRYYAVPRNSSLLHVFRDGIMRYWCRTLRRRSQRHRMTWPRMYALAQQWLPQPHILHPYPAQRLCVTTRGRSPVR